MLPKPLRGIITPLLTPLTGPDELDHGGLDRLIDHVIAGGVHGIFLLGTSGEGPALSTRVQMELVDRACAKVAGRIPVLAGVTHASLAEASAMARHAQRAGADAVVTAGPLYFPLAQPQLLDYLTRFGDASPLPLFLYNMPSHTHVRFEVETVLRAAEIPGVAGLKDSSGDIMYLHELHAALARRSDFSLLVGPEEMMAECVLFGIHGGVNGGSNLFPELYVALYHAAVAGDAAAMRSLQPKVIHIARRLYGALEYGSSGYLQGVKCAASILGLCAGEMAAPYRPYGDEKRAVIRRHLVELGFLGPASL